MSDPEHARLGLSHNATMPVDSGGPARSPFANSQSQRDALNSCRSRLAAPYALHQGGLHLQSITRSELKSTSLPALPLGCSQVKPSESHSTIRNLTQLRFPRQSVPLVPSGPAALRSRSPSFGGRDRPSQSRAHLLLDHILQWSLARNLKHPILWPPAPLSALWPFPRSLHRSCRHMRISGNSGSIGRRIAA